MSGEPAAPVSERRGGVVAGALICAVLLVIGYGSGIGIVPAQPVDQAAGEPRPGEDGAAGAEPGEALAPSNRATGTSRPGRPGISGTTTSPTIVKSARSVLPRVVPPSRTLPTPPGPGTTPPGSSPPGTATPPPNPPAVCADLVGSLVHGLIGYLAGPNPDAALVQRVSDVLGLSELLPSDRLVGDLVTPLLGTAVSTLGSTLHPNTNPAPVGVPDAGLVADLRRLLGVDVTGVVRVSAEQLTMLLDAVLSGC